ncbi:unnamed protein product [Trichogramma brassicae]|uniref:DNA-directed DNA polymerase n=1 Tax=Trichogramma brassicae TaxID=86971 RepID=A0A6H5J8E9_9HYME|nr:unnamed protein product [Trichogramma brassicae]
MNAHEHDYSEVIEELRRALRSGERIDEAVINEGIRYLENALSAILSRSKKHKYQSQLSHLLSIRARYEKRGLGLSDDEVRIKWEDVKSAFSCRIRTGQIVNFTHKDATAFLEDAFTIFEERIKETLAKHSMIKVNVELAAEYMTLTKDAEVIFGDKYFNTKNEHISQSTDLGEWFTTNVQQSILKQMEEFAEEGSGWTLSKILHLLVNINKYNPSRVGSYIPLPTNIKNKNACVNVQNFDDNFCFKWAILAALYSDKKKPHKERIEQYKKFENELNFSGIEFPMKLKDIPKFEKMNEISVNVYILKQNFDIEPIHLTALKREKHVRLLMIQDRYDDDEDSPGDKKVRDHSHITGEYRGAAHSKCNINYRDARFVPVIFHNLSGYDSHLFIREIATGFPGRVWVLPQTKERYISFVKFMEDQRLSFRFIDSFKFMASSLDKLALNLKQQPTLKKVFGQDYDDAQIDLLTKKGVFPYEYISSLEKLQETALPPPEQFYSSLTDSDISTKDYEHAKEVWGSFEISNLGEYSDLYLKTDVLLLVEVFENFRKTCHEAYELDPAHYYTLPGYSWDAMLLYTQVELELLTDVDMLLFVEKGIRGGVSQCCSRFAEANNRYMGEDYNPEKEDVYLMYYDVNNLYGWAMAQYLPYGGFEWDDAKDYLTLPEDSEYGYILEVDLEYPESTTRLAQGFATMSRGTPAHGLETA